MASKRRAIKTTDARKGSDRRAPKLTEIVNRLSHTGAPANEWWEQPFTDPAPFRTLSWELPRRQATTGVVTLSADEMHTLCLALLYAAERVEHEPIVATLLECIHFALRARDPRVFRNRMLGLADKRRRGKVYDTERIVQAYQELTERTDDDALRPRSVEAASSGEFIRLALWKSKTWEECGLVPPDGAKPSGRIVLPLSPDDAITVLTRHFSFRSWEACRKHLADAKAKRLPSNWDVARGKIRLAKLT